MMNVIINSQLHYLRKKLKQSCLETVHIRCKRHYKNVLQYKTRYREKYINTVNVKSIRLMNNDIEVNFI